jgi:hypothetical protein
MSRGRSGMSSGSRRSRGWSRGSRGSRGWSRGRGSMSRDRRSRGSRGSRGWSRGRGSMSRDRSRGSRDRRKCYELSAVAEAAGAAEAA